MSDTNDEKMRAGWDAANAEAETAARNAVIYRSLQKGFYNDAVIERGVPHKLDLSRLRHLNNSVIEVSGRSRRLHEEYQNIQSKLSNANRLLAHRRERARESKKRSVESAEMFIVEDNKQQIRELENEISVLTARISEIEALTSEISEDFTASEALQRRCMKFLEGVLI